MADVTLTLYGATGVSTVTPRFDFTSGTVKVYVEEGYVKDLTSGVEDSIALAVGEKLEYVCSNWDAITRIDINSDKVSGDISGWVLPATLVTFYVYNTGVSGDISGWVLPATLVNFYVNSTSVSYKSQGGAFTNVTNTLTKIDFDNCVLSSQQVDNVLADLVASGSISNQLDLAGTNKPPTIEGLKNKIILDNRGWTVVITAGRSVYASRPMFSRKRPELWTAAMAGEEEQWLTTMASDVCVTIG